jgi:2-(1,2-epoxy-1,2-dihydrophenyl)acetyl-CoA isomerase
VTTPAIHDLLLGYADWLDAIARDERVLVTVERPDPTCAVLRLDDPDNHNALSGPLTLQLQQALGALCADARLASIVLTGTGDFFSVGGDWQMMQERAHSYAERPEGTTGLWRWIRRQFGGIARQITGTEKIVIAAVNGHAAGVALAWALNCDLVFAAEEARLATAFARIGLVPEIGTNWALTRRLGYARAMELVLAGGTLDGREAAARGLVNAALPRAELMDHALEWCRRIAKLPEHVPAMTKPLLRSAADASFEQTLLAEEYAEPNTFTTRAHQETVRALLAKQERASDGR